MLTVVALAALATSQATPQQALHDKIEAIRSKYNLPSISAGAILDGNIVAMEAVGFRRANSDERVTIDDQYHCGSNTKSVTSALVGVLFQQGKIKWDTPLEALFPDFADKMNPAYRKVTPIYLMSHRSGFTGDTFTAGMPDYRKLKTPLPAQRWDYAKRALAEAPVAEPGTKFVYANRGFMVLGCALERITGKSWEDLVTEELLHPLGLKSAGFGAAGWATHTSQPWGHYLKDGKLVPVPPGLGGDNAAVLGPAGTLHMSVPDMLKWCWFMAQEGRNGGILEPSTFKVLHTPPFGGYYGGGLGYLDRAWGGGTVWTHAGSNTLNYEVMWIAPKKNFAVVVATNAVTPDVAKAVDEVAALLITTCLPK
jgi:CubicO group peptidase (beta-lactamase class C family)